MHALRYVSFALLWLTLPVAAAQEHPAPWRLHEPDVLDQREANSDEGGSALEVVDIVWLAGKPIVGLWRANTRELVLFREDRPGGAWAPWTQLEGLSRNPRMAVVGEHLYVASRISGRSQRSDVGTIQLWKFDAGGQLLHNQTCAAKGERGSKSVAYLGGHGSALQIWLTQPGEEQREIVARTSDDGGRSWRDLFEQAALIEGILSEGDERLPVVSLTDKPALLGCFLWQRQGRGELRIKNRWFHSIDGDKAWKSATAKLSDTLPAEGQRVILAAAPAGGELLAAYLAIHEQDEQAQFFFTKSMDRGQTWSRGTPLSQKRPLHVAGVPRAGLIAAGELVAFAHREGDDAEGVAGKLSISHDRGQSWRRLALHDYYRGPVATTPAVAVSPGGDRLLLATVVAMPDGAGGRAYFTVQEYSPRRPAAQVSGSAVQATIARLIVQLGDESYFARQKASRDLAALGRDAREPLLAAYRTATDVEVRQRLKLILARLFPACLQVR